MGAQSLAIEYTVYLKNISMAFVMLWLVFVGSTHIIQLNRIIQITPSYNKKTTILQHKSYISHIHQNDFVKITWTNYTTYEWLYLSILIW